MKNFGKKTIVAETAAKNETVAEEKEYVFAPDDFTFSATEEALSLIHI